MQLTFSKDGEPDLMLALTPLGLRDFFAMRAMEYAAELPITAEDMDKLAHNFASPNRPDFDAEAKEIVVGTILMVIRKHYSPTVLLKLLDDLARDPLAAMGKAQDDRFARFVMQTIRERVATSGRPSKEIIEEERAAVREVVRRGNPGNPARAVFYEAIVALAAKQGDDLALPSRDIRPGRPRSSSLFLFGLGMTRLLRRCGNWVLDRRGLARGRFDKFEDRRGALIKHLERGRSVIMQETSAWTPNSPKSGNCGM